MLRMPASPSASTLAEKDENIRGSTVNTAEMKVLRMVCSNLWKLAADSVADRQILWRNAYLLFTRQVLPELSHASGSVAVLPPSLLTDQIANQSFLIVIVELHFAVVIKANAGESPKCTPLIEKW